MVDWLSLLTVCSKRIREKFLDFFGSAEAGVAFGIGAGGDVIKKIDLETERVLIDTLRNHGASCTLISEETGVIKIGPQPSDFYLTVDPVDGTTNAIRGLPFMATSIAGSRKPFLLDVEISVVVDLFHNITYSAKRGYGALRNGEKITPSSTSSLEEAVIGIDFSTLKIRELATSLISILEKVRHIRHLGANALEVCYVADGTTDGFIDLLGKLRVTDIAAAFLIVREAGGIVVTPEGAKLDAPLTPTQQVSFIAAANTSIYQKIVDGLNLK